MPCCARMFTIPGASPQSGMTLTFCAAACVGERLLLEHDLGVAAEVAEVRARLDREPRHLEVEVVGQRAHHRVALPHQRQHRLAVAHVERRRDQPRSGVRREERRDRADVEVGQPHFAGRTGPAVGRRRRQSPAALHRARASASRRSPDRVKWPQKITSPSSAPRHAVPDARARSSLHVAACPRPRPPTRARPTGTGAPCCSNPTDDRRPARTACAASRCSASRRPRPAAGVLRAAVRAARRLRDRSGAGLLSGRDEILGEPVYRSSPTCRGRSTW